MHALKKAFNCQVLLHCQDLYMRIYKNGNPILLSVQYRMTGLSPYPDCTIQNDTAFRLCAY